MQTDWTLKQCVYAVAELPELPPVLFESLGEQQLLQIDKNFWRSISLWLRNFALAEPLSPDAYKGMGQYYQPYAEFFKGLLDLTNAVYRSFDNLVIKQYSSPAELWYHLIRSRARESLEKAGLFGKPLVAIAPKRENYQAVMKLCSQLEKHKWKLENHTPNQPLEELVYFEAQALAKADIRFHYKYLLPFLRVWRGTIKEVKYCKHLQNLCLLPDGSLFVTGKDKKLPPSL